MKNGKNGTQAVGKSPSPMETGQRRQKVRSLPQVISTRQGSVAFQHEPSWVFSTRSSIGLFRPVVECFLSFLKKCRNTRAQESEGADQSISRRFGFFHCNTWRPKSESEFVSIVTVAHTNKPLTTSP
jgi:hypothetical protein